MLSHTLRLLPFISLLSVSVLAQDQGQGQDNNPITQKNSTAPACVSRCFATKLQEVGNQTLAIGVSPQNVSALCGNPQFITAFKNCMSDHCNPQEIESGNNLQGQVCASASSVAASITSAVSSAASSASSVITSIQASASSVAASASSVALSASSAAAAISASLANFTATATAPDAMSTALAGQESRISSLSSVAMSAASQASSAAEAAANKSSSAIEAVSSTASAIQSSATGAQGQGAAGIVRVGISAVAAALGFAVMII